MHHDSAGRQCKGRLSDCQVGVIWLLTNPSFFGSIMSADGKPLTTAVVDLVGLGALKAPGARTAMFVRPIFVSETLPEMSNQRQKAAWLVRKRPGNFSLHFSGSHPLMGNCHQPQMA